MTIRMKDKKTSKGVAGSGLTQNELKELKFKNLPSSLTIEAPAGPIDLFVLLLCSISNTPFVPCFAVHRNSHREVLQNCLDGIP